MACVKSQRAVERSFVLKGSLGGVYEVMRKAVKCTS